MIRPSDKSSPKRRVADYQHNQSEYLKNLVKISDCVSTLSNMIAPDDDENCREFKRRQLHHLLAGDLLQMNDSRPSEIAQKMLQWPDKAESHLGILNARDIGCHYPKLSDENNVSVLDLHTYQNLNKTASNWCKNCLNIGRQHEPKFDLGIVNPFSCWRRGHQSGKLGFVQFCELSSGDYGVQFSTGKLHSSNLLKSLIHHNYPKFTLDPSTDNLSRYSSMIVMITINPDKRDNTDRLSEIRQILPKQLLVSRHIAEKEVNSSHMFSNFEDKDRIPEMVSNLLEEINATWRINGPSKDTKGVIGLALLNNSSTYAENESLQNHLQLFSEEHGIWFEKFEIDNMPDGLIKSLKISEDNIPINHCALCVILDPIINVGRDS